MTHNTEDVVAAARTVPSQRTADDRAAIASDASRQSVKNANHAAAREEKIYGPGGKKS